MSSVTRREFLAGSAALVGLPRKAGRTIEGGLVNESVVIGHQLRDGRPFDVPRETRQSPIVIVGGGIAGLSAAWRLQARGFREFVVVEMELQAGGNARWGENDVSGYPWAAHYVPLPGRTAGLTRELLEDLGLLDGTSGEWHERHLCFAPQERLWLHGRWQEGLVPLVGPTAREREQFSRFDDRMRAFRQTGDFTIPVAPGADPASPLDRLSMADWLDREGLDSPYLRWYVDYACRDDYGCLAADTSAWAGVHYFASREHEDEGPLTWPEGNGWIVRRLLERFGDRVHTGHVVTRVERRDRTWRVHTPRTMWLARAVIFAAPAFLASRLVDAGVPVPGFTYSPWFTANLTLDAWPAERGFAPAWDNVRFDSASLGYVVATHQTLRTHVPRTVWTFYWALAHQRPDVARRWLLVQDWAALRDRVLDDLSPPHPDIRDCVRRIDVMRLGHAMVRPEVGFLSSPARKRLQDAGEEGLFYGHSDLGGLPLFEEANYWGVRAADRALAWIG